MLVVTGDSFGLLSRRQSREGRRTLGYSNGIDFVIEENVFVSKLEIVELELHGHCL